MTPPRKCADIPDEVFLAAVKQTAPPYPGGAPWRMRWAVRATLEQSLGCELPEKLFLAKARKLGQRGLLAGCTDCTCRGDYHLPEECQAFRCCGAPSTDAS